MRKVKNFKKYKQELLLNPYKGMKGVNIEMIKEFRLTFKYEITFLTDVRVIQILNKYEKSLMMHLKPILIKYAEVGICDLELRYISGGKRMTWFKFNYI